MPYSVVHKISTELHCSDTAAEQSLMAQGMKWDFSTSLKQIHKHHNEKGSGHGE